VSYGLYLRKGILLVPTTGRVEGEIILRDIEPVEVVPISNTEAVRQALRATIARGNPAIPNFPPGKHPPPVVLKYAGVKTWSAFARDARSWTIGEKYGTYYISGYRKHAKGYGVEDPEQTIEFPAGTAVEDVIDRMIAILQDAAGT
jgi:hypothetical protein